jgi:hypothetical protein
MDDGSRRASSDARRPSGETVRDDTAPASALGGTDILEDMKRLQREIDELRIQSERGKDAT